MKSRFCKFLPPVIQNRIEWLQKSSIVRNSGWMLTGQFFRQAISFLVGILMARFFGPSLYGEYNFAVAFAAIFMPIGILGLDGIVIRDLARNPAQRDHTLGTSFVLMLGGGLGAFCLSLSIIYLIRPNDTLALMIVGITSAGALLQAFNAIEFWLESRLQWKFAVIAKNSALLVGAVVKVWLILAHAPVITIVWVTLAETVVGAAMLVRQYHAQGLRLTSWEFNRPIAAKLLHDSWPMMLSALTTMIYLRIDQIMLGTIGSNEELGIYVAAVRLTEWSGTISMAICSSLLPVMAQKVNDDRLLFEATQQKLYNLMAFLGYTVAIPTFLFSGWLVESLFGPAYIKAAPLLSVLVWSGLFTHLGTARTIFLVSMNWTKVNLICLLIGCICNVALNFLLIPRYGAMGAVFASSFAYWLAIHGSCIFFKPLHNTARMMTKALLFPKFW